MKLLLLAAVALVLSGCGQEANTPEPAKKGVFEEYTDSQVKALEKAKGVEGELKKADEARRKQLDQMQ